MAFGKHENPTPLVRLSRKELLEEMIRNEPQMMSVTVPASSEGGYPVNGFNCEGRRTKDFKVSSTQTLTGNIQGRDSESDEFATLQNDAADTVYSKTLTVPGSFWFGTTHAANYIRLWLKNATTTDAVVLIRFCGGP